MSWVDLNALFEQVMSQGGSDLHLLAGEPPRMRRFGALAVLSENRLAGDVVHEVLNTILPNRLWGRLEAEDDVDFGMEIPEFGRFRVNVFRHLNGLGAVFRLIPRAVRSLEALGLPLVLKALGARRQGLVLVTGKTGSGKSTTLAAMIHAINRSRLGHIITLEDPIEFIHERQHCLISQREIGTHAQSFAGALKSALREDPDVILVGELRDLETMSLAVTAAETGILVFGTLHTSNAAATIDRLVNSFPVKRQAHIRTMLSTSLAGIVAQQLIARADGKGQVAAIEILVNTPAAANLIREGKTDQLINLMQSDAQIGMQSMDSAIQQLLDRKLISLVSAVAAAVDKSRFA